MANEVSIFLNLSEDLKDRLNKQANRFGASTSTLIRMAVTKWLEEEETVQEEHRERQKKTKLIPKSQG